MSAQPQTRVEWFGRIQVHQPVKPATVHATAKAFAVSCA